MATAVSWISRPRDATLVTLPPRDTIVSPCCRSHTGELLLFPLQGVQKKVIGIYSTAG